MAGMAALSHKLDALAEQLGQHAQASLSQVLQSVQTGNTALLAGPSAAAVAAVGDSVARAFREALAKNLMPDLQRSLSASSSLPSPSTPPLSQQSLPSPSRHSSAGSMPGAPITPEGSVVGGNEPSCSHSMSGSAALMSNGNNSQPFAAEHLAPATAAAVAAAPAGGEAGSPVFADRADSSPLTTTQSNLVAALPAEATQQACHSESDQATLQATLEGLSLMQLQSASSAGSAAGRAQGERELQGATGGNAGQQQLSSEAQQAPQLIVLDGEHTTWRLTVEQQQQHLQHLQQQQQLLSLAGSNAQTHLPMLLPGSALASVGSVGSGTTTLRGSAPLPSFPSLPGPASGSMQGGYETLAGNLQARAAQMRRFSCEIPASASQALSAGPLSAAGGAHSSSQQAGQQQQQQQGQGGQALGTGAFRGLTISGGHLQSSQTLSELLHAAESGDGGAGRTSAPAQDSSQAAKATAMQQAQQAHVQAQLLQQQLLLSGSPHHPAAAYNLNLLNLANQQVLAQAQAQAQVQAQAVHQGGPFAMAAERELAALLAQQGLGDTSSASPAAGGASVGAFGSPGISQGLSPSPGPASGSVLQGAPCSGGMAPGVAAAFRSLPGTPGTRAMHDMFSAHLAAEQQQHQAAQQTAQQPRVQGVNMSGLGPGAGGLLSAALSQQHQAQQQQQQLQQAVEGAQQAALEQQQQQQLEGYDRRLPNLGTLPHMHSMPAMHNISDLIMMSQPTIMEHTVLDDMDSGMNFLSGPQSTGRPHDVLNEYLLARQAHAQASHPGLQVSGGQIGSPMSNANLLSLIQQQQQQQQQQGQRHLHNAAAAAAYAAAAATFASAVNGRGPGMPSGGSVGGGVGLAGRPMEIPVRLKALPEMVQIRIMTLTATNNVISVKDFDEKVVNKICLLVDMHGAEEALAMLSHLEHRMRTKQGVMKNGPGYLDVAVSSHLDMLKAQGSCPRNMSTEEYAAHTLSPAVMHELKEAVGNNKWLEWEHLDQGIIQLIKKLPKDSAVEKLQEISYHSFKNVDNIKGCIMSILNSKIREDRRKQ